MARDSTPQGKESDSASFEETAEIESADENDSASNLERITQALRESLERETGGTPRVLSEEEVEEYPLIPEFVPDFETETQLATVGSVGGFRFYVPARFAKDSQFPFKLGDPLVLRVFRASEGLLGLVVGKREDCRRFELGLEWVRQALETPSPGTPAARVDAIPNRGVLQH